MSKVILFGILFTIGLSCVCARADSDVASNIPVGKSLITIYADQRQTGWTSLSTANVDLACQSPVHSGQASIRVDMATISHANLEFAADPFDASRYGALTFWIDGGPTGGQRLVVEATLDGVAQKSVALTPLAANSWTEVVLPLKSLGVGDSPHMTGFRIESASDATVSSFFVDDISLNESASRVPIHVPVPFKPTGQALQYTGVNIAGGAFAHPKPGRSSVYGKEFIYPTVDEIEYFRARGVNVIRLPFLWEVLQPSLDAPILPVEMQRLTDVVTMATQKGVTVMLDPHDFERYFGNLIGGPLVSNAQFATFWSALATQFKDNPRVWFALMNEPNSAPIADWFESAQSAVTAIRKTGAKNLILVPGTDFTGAHDWLEDGSVKMLQIKDPANNFQFEVHQYLDGDNSGMHPDTVSATVGSDRLKEFTLWCRKVHKHAFLGEIGIGEGTVNHAALDNMLGYMEANRDVWLGFSYWAAGAWWGDYMYNVEPMADGSDRPQMLYLTPHLHGL